TTVFYHEIPPKINSITTLWTKTQIYQLLLFIKQLRGLNKCLEKLRGLNNETTTALHNMLLLLQAQGTLEKPTNYKSMIRGSP
ncbi:hypothetical protein VIGAN_01192600, partial [Vigna angularis var. angularis]